MKKSFIISGPNVLHNLQTFGKVSSKNVDTRPEVDSAEYFPGALESFQCDRENFSKRNRDSGRDMVPESKV